MGALRMRWFNLLVPVMALTACVAALAQMPTYHLGRTPSAEEIRAWDIAIGPEGKELPPGSGTAKEGAKIYAQKCAVCHGPTGTEGGPPHTAQPPRLVGGKDTIREWSFATPIWDYINRAMPAPTGDYSNRSMPPKEEGSLSADEVYALTAFLLYRNGIIQESDVLDAKSLPKIQMPNRKGSIPSP